MNRKNVKTTAKKKKLFYNILSTGGEREKGETSFLGKHLECELDLCDTNFK